MDLKTEQVHTITVNDAERAQLKLAIDIISETCITDRRKKLTERNLQIDEDSVNALFHIL